jgi:hypothetical protein
MPASTTVAEALGISGTAKDQPITERQALALIEELKESAPLQGMSKVTEIQPPFPRPPGRPIGSFRGLPQKANS